MVASKAALGEGICDLVDGGMAVGVRDATPPLLRPDTSLVMLISSFEATEYLMLFASKQSSLRRYSRLRSIWVGLSLLVFHLNVLPPSSGTGNAFELVVSKMNATLDDGPLMIMDRRMKKISSEKLCSRYGRQLSGSYHVGQILRHNVARLALSRTVSPSQCPVL